MTRYFIRSESSRVRHSVTTIITRTFASVVATSTSIISVGEQRYRKILTTLLSDANSAAKRRLLRPFSTMTSLPYSFIRNPMHVVATRIVRPDICLWISLSEMTSDGISFIRPWIKDCEDCITTNTLHEQSLIPCSLVMIR